MGVFLDVSGGNDTGVGGIANDSDCSIEAESTHSREGIMRALGPLGKHLQSMMAAQGALLATSQNLQDRIRRRKPRHSGGSSSKRRPEAAGGILPRAKKRSTNPESRWACTSPSVAMLTPAIFYHYVHITCSTMDR
jgi:hypothetical protein